MIIEFIIPGFTKGKERPRFVRRGNFVSTYTPQATHNYQNIVKNCYLEASGGRLLDGAVKAEIYTIYEPPKSISKKKREKMLSGEIPYTKKPDNDNIAKSILDGLNGVAFKDDSTVNDLRVQKTYGENAMCLVRLSDNKNVMKPIFFIDKEE